MKTDDHNQTKDIEQNDFIVRQSADTANDVIQVAHNATTATKLAQGLSAGVAVSGAGVAAGGAGMMSGLAAVGSVVGGGAVAGIGILGAAPVAATQAIMNNVLADDATLPTEERDARAVGRTMTTVGALAGAAGTVGTISAAGSVAGLSGAGITSGLAAIGSVTGGGMVAGAAIAVAAPAVAAASIGYGAYKIWQWMTSAQE